MRLVIERDGGFTVVEDADAITEIDVRSDAVVLTIEVGGDKWTTTLPVSSHAEACRVSAAVAVKCGELVEPLAVQPEEIPEPSWRFGEPPKDGNRYVVSETTRFNELSMATWDGEMWARWEDGGEVIPVAHLRAAIVDSF